MKLGFQPNKHMDIKNFKKKEENVYYMGPVWDD